MSGFSVCRNPLLASLKHCRVRGGPVGGWLDKETLATAPRPAERRQGFPRVCRELVGCFEEAASFVDASAAIRGRPERGTNAFSHVWQGDVDRAQTASKRVIGQDRGACAVW